METKHIFIAVSENVVLNLDSVDLKAGASGFSGVNSTTNFFSSLPIRIS